MYYHVVPDTDNSMLTIRMLIYLKESQVCNLIHIYLGATPTELKRTSE